MVVFFFYGLCAKYISMIYIVMVEDNQGGGAMDLGASSVDDGDHSMTHKMEIKCEKDHIISHYLCM